MDKDIVLQRLIDNIYNLSAVVFDLRGLEQNKHTKKALKILDKVLPDLIQAKLLIQFKDVVVPEGMEDPRINP